MRSIRSLSRSMVARCRAMSSAVPASSPLGRYPNRIHGSLVDLANRGDIPRVMRKRDREGHKQRTENVSHRCTQSQGWGRKGTQLPLKRHLVAASLLFGHNGMQLVQLARATSRLSPLFTRRPQPHLAPAGDEWNPGEVVFESARSRSYAVCCLQGVDQC